MSDQKAAEFHKCHLPSDPHNWQLNIDFPNKHLSYFEKNLENLPLVIFGENLPLVILAEHLVMVLLQLGEQFDETTPDGREVT